MYGLIDRFRYLSREVANQLAVRSALADVLVRQLHECSKVLRFDVICTQLVNFAVGGDL